MIGDDATVFLVYISGRGTHIATQKLKVSSLRYYNLLVAGTPILRITGVFERYTHGFIMEHGGDFVLRPEPGWSLRPVSRANA